MSLNDDCVLVTGGSGFIGSYLARHLLNQGYEVHLLLRKGAILKYFAQDLVNAVRWDILDVTDIIHAVRASYCNTIFHCAANMENEEDEFSVQRLIEGNFSFGVHLVHAAANVGCKYFINTGTYWQYDQTSLTHPNTLYAALKQSFQTVLSYYCSQSMLLAANLVLHNVYGDHDERKKILNLFLYAACCKQILNLSPGKQILNFVHITDVLKAYELVWNNLKRPKLNEVSTYHVHHEQYNLIEIAKLFEDFGMKIHCNWSILPYPKNQIMIPYCGPIVPGWQPEEKLANWIKKQINLQTSLI